MSQKLFSETETQTKPAFKVNFVLITKTSGVPIYYQVVDPSGAPNDVTLLSGFTSAITSLFSLLQRTSTSNNMKKTAELYYFGLDREKYYLYQKEDYLISISLSFFKNQDAMNPDIHNHIINMIENVWKAFSRIAKKSFKNVESSRREGKDHIDSTKLARMLKKNITEVLSETTSNNIDNRYYLLLEEIIEHYNFNEDTDLNRTIASLVQVFLSLLQE